MRAGRRQEAAKRRRKEIGERVRGDFLNQASISAYMLAVLGIVLMLAYSVRARDGFSAAGLTCQTAAALLLTPEILRPLGRIPYLQRPLSTIRTRRRGFAIRGTLVLVVALVLLAMRALNLLGVADNDLLGGLVFLAMIVGFLYAIAILVIWFVEGIFEGAAETWLQEALRQLDPIRTREFRLTIAALLFILGTLFLYADSYL
ncbi:MAG TPA: hypothetical protein VG448_13540 [Solirubrobacterales bacterium]|nr:hypothetical protein [Solirubrobacterales bacterium]